VIRPFGLRDLFHIRQLDLPITAFDVRRLLLYAPSVTGAAVLGYFTRHHLGAVTYMQQQNSQAGELEGFVEAWPIARRPEWDLAFVAPAIESKGTDKVWRRLLSSLIVAAAEKDISRIYARAPEDTQTEQVLRQVGFTLVKREEIFSLTSQPDPVPRVAGLRRVGREDSSALSALCRRAQPRLGGNAERVSSYRGSDFYPHLQTHTVADQYMWIRENAPVAYLGLQGSSRGYWLDIIRDPDNRSNLLSCIKHVLSSTKCAKNMPVYCPVPDYSSELGSLLRELGFTSYTRQVVLVAHTIARVREKYDIPVSALDRGVEIGTPVGQMFETPMQKMKEERICDV